MMGQAFPIQLESPSGLKVQVNANGSIRRMDLGDVLLNLFLGTEVEGGPANLYLRRHGEAIEWIPLLGPQSPSQVEASLWGCPKRGVSMRGECWGVRYTVALVLAASASAWFWHVDLENVGDQAEVLDLIYVQDLGLADYGLVRSNEYFVSQYLDHTPLFHPQRGFVLASRQNLAVAGRHPWCVIGALGKGVSFASDALQVYGLASRAGRIPVGVARGLPGERRQHEHAMAAIQDSLLPLKAGMRARRGFFGWLEADHPGATSDADLAIVDKAQSLPEAFLPLSPGEKVGVRGSQPKTTLFSTAPLLDAREPAEVELSAWFGTEWRQLERDECGRLLSFFTDQNCHVVLKAKELSVLRPHGHILATFQSLVPDEASLTSTVWMAGIFHSQLTQGNVAINRFLSAARGYVGLFRARGLRVFVELSGTWHLLDVPSAFAMTPQGCRWLYRHAVGLIECRSMAHRGPPQTLTFKLSFLQGAPCRCLIVFHLALGGEDGDAAAPVRHEWHAGKILVRPPEGSELAGCFPTGSFVIEPLPGTTFAQVGGDALLFLDGRPRGQPFLCLVTSPTPRVGLRILGGLVTETAPGVLSSPLKFESLKIHPPTPSQELAALQEILPWFHHNALIHYLSPRGLEQYTGGGWGTRDVTQGAVEMLLALGCFEPVRELLLRVFKNQNPDGDWPQWFMVFDRERSIRACDAHGDIVFWPVLALARYLAASEDASLLTEVVPFFHPGGEDQAERASVWQHVERALGVMEARVIPGTCLAAYGRGDWNDSLEPVDPAMGEQLCSAWTVALEYQTLTALAEALRRLDLVEEAERLSARAAEVHGDFQRYLIADGILAGFAWFHGDGRIAYLMHPRDRITGISYRLLPMIHAILAGMLAPHQAELHLGLIRQRLLGPDGARLFDHPLKYRGGPQRLFQRAESSSFFGREIGLMYTHAHLRYAQALAHYGDAQGFFEALGKVNPIGLRARIPNAARRQANCYYTSSDAACFDRYQAYAQYARVLAGEIPLQGGWRVYSSGPGVFVSLIVTTLFGLRLERSRLVIDPVMPSALNGLRIELELLGRKVAVTYHIGQRGFGLAAVHLNGADLPFTRGPNPYREGGAEVPMAEVTDKLKEGENQLVLWIG